MSVASFSSCRLDQKTFLKRFTRLTSFSINILNAMVTASFTTGHSQRLDWAPVAGHSWVCCSNLLFKLWEYSLRNSLMFYASKDVPSAISCFGHCLSSLVGAHLKFQLERFLIWIRRLKIYPYLTLVVDLRITGGNMFELFRLVDDWFPSPPCGIEDVLNSAILCYSLR